MENLRALCGLTMGLTRPIDGTFWKLAPRRARSQNSPPGRTYYTSERRVCTSLHVSQCTTIYHADIVYYRVQAGHHAGTDRVRARSRRGRPDALGGGPAAALVRGGDLRAIRCAAPTLSCAPPSLRVRWMPSSVTSSRSAEMSASVLPAAHADRGTGPAGRPKRPAKPHQCGACMLWAGQEFFLNRIVCGVGVSPAGPLHCVRVWSSSATTPIRSRSCVGSSEVLNAAVLDHGRY